MLTRNECLEIVRHPGKFESCAPYVPYFWDASLEGFADYERTRFGAMQYGFKVTPDDRAIFPELKGIRTVWLVETDSGFVIEL